MNPFRLKCPVALGLFFLACLVGTTLAEAPPEIVLGMSTALSGSAAYVGQDIRLGIMVGLARANRNGGVNGRKLRLIVLDDGYEPARTMPNMRSLLEKENVLAVIGNVGTATAIAALPVINEEKTLLFAPVSGGRVLRDNPPARYIINYRASDDEETAAMIDGLIGHAGLQVEDIAFFTQRDNYGDAGFAGGLAALKRHGLRDARAILHVRYERNTLAVENAVASLLVAEHAPRAVVMVGGYAPCTKFIKLCREAEFNPVFLGVSFVGSRSLAQVLGTTDAQVIVTQVVPDPLDQGIPIACEYQIDLKALDPSASAGFADFEGYIAARILTLALNKIKSAPTREAVVDALETLGQFEIGLGEPLNLSRDEHQASHRVWPTKLKEGVFVPFTWSDIAGEFKKDTAR
ncbi:MAG TPA: ABC transporter substrate-binding protein [Chthoniobacterales bacterium]